MHISIFEAIELLTKLRYETDVIRSSSGDDHLSITHDEYGTMWVVIYKDDTVNLSHIQGAVKFGD